VVQFALLGQLGPGKETQMAMLQKFIF
jgi:hypothetical protein